MLPASAACRKYCDPLAPWGKGLLLQSSHRCPSLTASHCLPVCPRCLREGHDLQYLHSHTPEPQQSSRVCMPTLQPARGADRLWQAFLLDPPLLLDVPHKEP